MMWIDEYDNDEQRRVTSFMILNFLNDLTNYQTN